MALVVGNGLGQSQEEFEEQGFDFCSMDQLKDLVKSGAVLRHKFLVLLEKVEPNEWAWLNENLNTLPFRILLRNGETDGVPEGMEHTIADLGSGPWTEPGEFRDACWTAWNRKWYSNYKIYVSWINWKGTFADDGGKKSKKPDLDKGKWIVFAHPGAGGSLPSYTAGSMAYHQSFKGGTPTAHLLNEGKEKEPTREAAAASVAIIDERIWRTAKDAPAKFGVDGYQNKNMKEVWEKRGVHILDATAAMANFANFVKENIWPLRGAKFDFIVLHRGIIPRTMDEADQETWEVLQGKARWLILDTGAGKPTHPLTKGLRWVEYSNLSECLVDSAGDKFRLMDLLWSLRATKQ